MRKIKTPEEYVELIKLAYEELDDIQDAIEYDEEFMGDARPLLQPIRESLNDLVEQINSGQYSFNNNSDLPFIEIIKNTLPHLLPCGPVLLQINHTHTQGLDKD